jgi:hypothetical protein
MSNLPSRGDINIRSGGYFVARTVGRCRRCHASTHLLALALAPRHETLSTDADADDEGEQLANGAWEVAARCALLFFVEYLPDTVLRRLLELSPHYRFGDSAATSASYLMNHCDRCGSPLGDHDLFCEPEGAFGGMSHTSAAAMQLFWIDEPIEATAAGYSYDPQLFGPMLEA